MWGDTSPDDFKEKEDRMDEMSEVVNLQTLRNTSLDDRVLMTRGHFVSTSWVTEQ